MDFTLRFMSNIAFLSFYALEHLIDAPAAVSFSQVAIDSYLGKPPGQDMLLEPANKFQATKRHLLLLITIAIILIPKCDRIIRSIYADNPVITDLPTGRQMVTLCVYLPRYSMTAAGTPKDPLVFTTQPSQYSILNNACIDLPATGTTSLFT